MLKAYSIEQAISDLGGIPSDAELARVVRYYPSFKKPYRAQLLKGMFEGKSQKEIVAGKIEVEGLSTQMSAQSKGGHGKKVAAKIRRTAIRLLYLRYRLDEKVSQIKANNLLLLRFTDPASLIETCINA